MPENQLRAHSLLTSTSYYCLGEIQEAGGDALQQLLAHVWFANPFS